MNNVTAVTCWCSWGRASSRFWRQRGRRLYIHISPRSLPRISLSFYHGEIFNIAALYSKLGQGAWARKKRKRWRWRWWRKRV